MKDDTFLKDSIILSVSSLTTGILRFIFSVILSKELGSEGMGLYSIIMPIYDLFCCLICGGIVTAISKEAASYYGKNQYGNLNKSIKATISFSLIWSIFICILVFLFSPFISKHIIKDSRTIYSLWVICPALIFVALSSIYKGYFYGISKVSIPAFIDIGEKAVRMVMIVGLIKYLSLKSITSTVTSTYIALSIGEFISFILLFIFYKKDSKEYHYINNKTENKAQLLFNILIIAFPLCINSVLTTAISTLSTLIIPRRLVIAGLTYSTALSMIGKFAGMALSIVFFPLIIVISMATLITPDISKSMSQKDCVNTENRISSVLKISFLLGVSTLIICSSIPNSLGQLFFNRNDLGIHIKLASFSAPFIYVSASSFGILNGFGKQKVILINSVISSIVQLILLYILLAIPSINILGYGLALLGGAVVGLVLNMIQIRKNCSLNFSIVQIFIDICLSVLLYFILIIMNNIIPNSLFTFKVIILIASGFSLVFLSTLINRKAKN